MPKNAEEHCQDYAKLFGVYLMKSFALEEYGTHKAANEIYVRLAVHWAKRCDEKESFCKR